MGAQRMQERLMNDNLWISCTSISEKNTKCLEISQISTNFAHKNEIVN